MWLGQANGGFELNANAQGSTASRDWAIAGIGDYNGDGRDDVLWRHAGGTVSEWLGKADAGFVNNHANAAASVPHGLDDPVARHLPVLTACEDRPAAIDA